jgi:hypothetical protein
MADVGQEALAEAGLDAQRHHEVQSRAGDLAQRLRLPAGRVEDQQAARPGELAQPLQALRDQRHLGHVARLGAHVERDAVGAGGLQRPHLARDARALRPAVGHQRRVLVGARDPQRGQIDVQPPAVEPEALDRARGQRATQCLRVDRQRLQRAPEPIIVEQRRRDPEQLLQRRARRPPGDVIQGRGRTQPAADQRRHRLPDRQLLTPPLRQRAIDRRDQLQLADELPRQQQRPDLTPHPRQRRIEPREGTHQLLQLARRLQLLFAP